MAVALAASLWPGDLAFDMPTVIRFLLAVIVGPVAAIAWHGARRSSANGKVAATRSKSRWFVAYAALGLAFGLAGRYVGAVNNTSLTLAVIASAGAVFLIRFVLNQPYPIEQQLSAGPEPVEAYRRFRQPGVDDPQADLLQELQRAQIMNSQRHQRRLTLIGRSIRPVLYGIAGTAILRVGLSFVPK
ncbi:MAG: hypothetical protein E6I89_00350 [Chloroflexi bacterium]|nr:MAG: hypothetical protein E6I89_00350 [Chloroflexota bacterium]